MAETGKPRNLKKKRQNPCGQNPHTRRLPAMCWRSLPEKRKWGQSNTTNTNGMTGRPSYASSNCSAGGGAAFWECHHSQPTSGKQLRPSLGTAEVQPLARRASRAIKDRAGCSFAQVEFCSDLSARKSKHKKMSCRSWELQTSRALSWLPRWLRRGLWKHDVGHKAVWWKPHGRG